MKVNPNNTVVVKTRTGSKEYLYNTMPKTSEVPKPKETLIENGQKEETAKRKYQKRTFEGRKDGGPITRSRKTEILSASLSYAEVLKKPKLINSKPSVKLINPQT